MLEEQLIEVYTNYYIYTTVVNDIILNPEHPSLDVNRKPLGARLQKFRVCIDFVLLFLKN